MLDVINECVENLPAGLFVIKGKDVFLLNDYMCELVGSQERKISEKEFWDFVDNDEAREKIINAIPTRFKIGKGRKNEWVEYRGTINDMAIFGCLIEITSHVLFDKKMSAVEKVSREQEDMIKKHVH